MKFQWSDVYAWKHFLKLAQAHKLTKSDNVNDWLKCLSEKKFLNEKNLSC